MADEIQSLVVRCRGGETDAINDLVERFRGRVFALCYRMLGHRQDAEDMVQESFSRAIRSLGRWDEGRPFVPWLLAIAGNRCRTLLSRRKRFPQPNLTEVVDWSPADTRCDELAEEVALALAELRPEHQQAFLLFHEQELSYHDIALRLGVPLGTVKTWVHRARRGIVDRLHERGVVEEVRDALPTS
ncbi:MAG: RNA polymerase sigma factor [Pirellulales bacterium]